MQALLHLVCSEWQTMSDYVKTRLSQIDWEIVDPEKFASNNHIDGALKKLHMWRRFIPLYREMLTETLEQVFHFPCHTEKFPGSNTIVIEERTPRPDGVSHMGTNLSNQRPFGRETLGEDAPGGPIPLTMDSQVQEPEPGTTAGRSGGRTPVNQTQCDCPAHATAQPRVGPITAYRNDFLLALSHMEEYQARIERLTHVVTAAMKIDDSRRATSDARNIGRLTWLATFFLPFSLIATAFSMQADVSVMTFETIRLYFASSVPAAVFTVVVAWTLSQPLVQKQFKHITGRDKRKGS
jgi:hypothetical protein